MPNLKYEKEHVTILCEQLTDRLQWLTGSGGLASAELDCIRTLLPQLNIAAALFRQCAEKEAK